MERKWGWNQKKQGQSEQRHRWQSLDTPLETVGQDTEQLLRAAVKTTHWERGLLRQAWVKFQAPTTVLSGWVEASYLITLFNKQATNLLFPVVIESKWNNVVELSTSPTQSKVSVTAVAAVAVVLTLKWGQPNRAPLRDCPKPNVFS